jgi:hypothetical protein
MEWLHHFRLKRVLKQVLSLIPASGMTGHFHFTSGLRHSWHITTLPPSFTAELKQT